MRFSWDKVIGVTKKMDISYDKNEAVFRREFEQAVNDNQTKSCKKAKRFRSAFTTEQVNYLESEFKKYPYIGNTRRKEVAHALNIQERAVKIWFQNRRMKEKKDGYNKETDEMKNIDLCDDKLRNLSVITTNANSSIAVHNVPKDVPNTLSKEKSEDKIDLSIPRCVRSDFFKDISPERDEEYVSSNSFNLLKKKNVSPSPVSADSSMEVLQKYRKETSKEDNENISKSNNRQKESLLSSVKDTQISEENYVSPYFSASSSPQDLSYKRCSSSNYQRPKENTVAESQSLGHASNVPHTEMPLYLKGFYAQPYVPPGNIIWKPLNIAPVMSTGFPAVNLNSPVNITANQQNMPKSCNCDCHLKPYCTPMVLQPNNPSPQVQYVITAVPLQNHSPKF